MCGFRAFGVDKSNSDMQAGSLLHQRYLENSVSGSLSEIGLNTSYKARVESVLQWATCEIWLADRRRAQNFNRETSLEVNYWHVDCLRLNQHLMYLLYISRYITFCHVFRRTTVPSLGSLIFNHSILGASTCREHSSKHVGKIRSSQWFGRMSLKCVLRRHNVTIHILD